MYYAIILGAVGMFGVQFLFNSRYQRAAGSSFRSSLFSICGTGLVGLVALLLINRFSLTITRFNLGLAAIAAVCAVIESVCVIYALGKINLSLYSVFSMVGGMLLPFTYGLIGLHEGMTIAKAICLLLICVGIAFTFRRGNGEKTHFWIFYVGVFAFNGLNGIYSQIFTASDKPKGVAGDYSILCALLKTGLALLLLLVIGLIGTVRARKKAEIQVTNKTQSETSRGTLALFRKEVLLPLMAVGLLNSVANYLLLISLDHVPGSMQYPLVTGGVMICSTLLGFLTDKKPGRKDILAVTFCFLGMLALLLPF